MENYTCSCEVLEFENPLAHRIIAFFWIGLPALIYFIILILSLNHAINVYWAIYGILLSLGYCCFFWIGIEIALRYQRRNYTNQIDF